MTQETPRLPRLIQVAQHAEDLERAVAFYRDTLGLHLDARFDPPGMAFFRLGRLRLLVEAAAPSTLLYIEVEDIEAERARLEAAGVVFSREPHLVYTHDGTFSPAGLQEWLAFFHDSEGNLLALVERRQS
ncbi:MAG: VOC family protein [Acidimicrobiales bacterium]|jgi:methylmalonyl-CoA/ethylmalonyl-CoA epimerase|nr:VOC family protein [Acidimicrobiales bacterium]